MCVCCNMSILSEVSIHRCIFELRDILKYSVHFRYVNWNNFYLNICEKELVCLQFETGLIPVI